MPAIPGNPFKIKNATLALDGDTFEDLISLAELVPAPVQSRFTAINGKKHALVGESEWTLNLTFAQDWTTAGSLSNKLFADEGEIVTATLTPIDGGPGFEVEITLVSGNVGGAADADAVSTVALGCTSKPEIIPAAP